MHNVSGSGENLHWTAEGSRTSGAKKLHFNGKECVIVTLKGAKTNFRPKDIDDIARHLSRENPTPLSSGEKLTVNLGDGRRFEVYYKNDKKAEDGTAWIDTEGSLKNLPQAISDVKKLRETYDSKTVSNILRQQLTNLKSWKSVSKDIIEVDDVKRRHSPQSKTDEYTRKIVGRCCINHRCDQ